MAGYSYFDYDQMTLLGIEVHSDELELLQQAADMYVWETIKTEVEPKFKEAALDFRDQGHSFVCPRKDELEEDLQETFPFLDEMAETEVAASGLENYISVGRASRPTGQARRLFHQSAKFCSYRQNLEKYQ